MSHVLSEQYFTSSRSRKQLRGYANGFTGEEDAIAELMLNLMGAFAQFERSLIKERQREGIY